MSDNLRPLSDYPDLDFIGGYTLEKLESEMIGWYKEKYKEIKGREPAFGRASTPRLLLSTFAYYIFQGMKISENNAKMNTLKDSIGEYLNGVGMFFRVPRTEAAAATTTLRFSMLSARTNATGIPAGTRVTAGDGIYFATQEYAEIPVGDLYIDVRATCGITGEDGNMYGVGELSRMVDIVPFIDSVTNLTAPENGTDEQEEEDYRESIYMGLDGYAAAGPTDAYKYWVMKFSSLIIDAKVRSPEPRVLEIMCLLDGGELPGEEFQSALKEYIMDPGTKMLTDKVNVINPTVKNYDIDLTYYINQSDKSKAELIQKNVEAAIENYILWQKSRIGRDINPSILTQLIVNAGAKRAEIRKPVFEGVEEDVVAISGGKIAIYGGLEDD